MVGPRSRYLAMKKGLQYQEALGSDCSPEWAGIQF